MAERRVVGLVFGGRSVEHQVSIRSARTVASALAEAGYVVEPLGVAVDGGWADPSEARRALAGELDLLAGRGGGPRQGLERLADTRLDVVFPLVHGTWGEDGTLQGFLEILDLAYVGAGVAASAVAMDKVLCKRVLEAVGIPVVESAVVRRPEWQEGGRRQALLASIGVLPLPVFVKPAVGGSSVGVRRVEDGAAVADAIDFALEFGDTVLVERGIRGRELECAVLGYRELAASAVGEIVPGREFYDYTDKYLEDGARLEAPAKLPAELAERVGRLAVEAFAAIGGEGMARVDFLLEEDGRLWVNEINTLPGFTSISMYPRLWGLSGLPLPRLVGRLVEIGIERHRDRAGLDAGIKAWVGSLGEARG